MTADSKHSMVSSSEDSLPDSESPAPVDLQTSLGSDYVLAQKSYLSEEQKKKVVAHVQKIQPETTVFVSIMKKSSVQSPGYLYIPSDYAAVHFPCETGTVTLQTPGKNKKWYPRFYKRKDKSGSSNSLPGWNTGTGENVSSESNSHGVSHESQESEESDGPPEHPYVLPGYRGRRSSELQKKIIKEKVQAIQSEVPIYVATMGKTSTLGGSNTCILELGSRYAAAHLPARNQPMLL
ncbi:hypothetical protein GUJ93_ZPchr0003g18491 [Zizania palustris]|uniref:Uncharacterized protein n=1 Tax=Zizania palustris TaxID=103762 RepID=A0A8J5SG82_ZIZPA|nr:hypothetical protein GUJ93_ZPchr0003g18491 [Zizania palustris]